MIYEAFIDKVIELPAKVQFDEASLGSTVLYRSNYLYLITSAFGL